MFSAAIVNAIESSKPRFYKTKNFDSPKKSTAKGGTSKFKTGHKKVESLGLFERFVFEKSGLNFCNRLRNKSKRVVANS